MNLKQKLKPAFCIIAPTNYLDRYATQSNRHLALAHLVDSDEKYASFYKRMSERGDYIIMDNGAFELGESYPPSLLVKLGKKIGASCIVLPDYPFYHSQKTIEAAVQWGEDIKSQGFDTMFVPQSERGNVVDWISGYVWASYSPLVDIIGMSILGIPNALPDIPAAYARVVMTYHLIEKQIFNFQKYHHYLGLTSGPKLEIPALLKMGALDSCDSSNPVWTGILGHEYSNNTDSFLSVSKPTAHVQFDYPFVKDVETHKRIQTNITMTLNLFKGEE